MRFIISDGGRSTSRRPKQSNDCTVRAIALSTSTPYDVVYDDLAKAGRVSGGRFDIRAWASKRIYNGHRFVWKPLQAVAGQPRVNPWSFAEMHPRGVYILRTAKHVFTCIDGILYDDFRPDDLRCVYGFWEVIY